MGSSLILDNVLISGLAEKIANARKLYGPDSAYVIGMVTAFEWMVAGVDGGEGARQMLRDRILESESGRKAQPRPAREAVEQPERGEGLPENTWIKGVVKWFNNDKGYGFISTDSHIDVFVHWRDISSWDRSLSQGDEVEFMVTKTAKGFQAINVMKGGQEERGEAAAEEAGDEAEVEGGESVVGPTEEGESPDPESPDEDGQGGNAPGA